MTRVLKFLFVVDGKVITTERIVRFHAPLFVSKYVYIKQLKGIL